jgi:hypothetical protein
MYTISCIDYAIKCTKVYLFVAGFFGSGVGDFVDLESCPAVGPGI